MRPEVDNILHSLRGKRLTKDEVQAIVIHAVLSGPSLSELEAEELWNRHPSTIPEVLHLKDAKFERDESYPFFEIVMKWDGCCHLHEFGAGFMNGTDNTEHQYWHLCGPEAIDEMIERLQEAKKKAREFFKDHDPGKREWNP